MEYHILETSNWFCVFDDNGILMCRCNSRTEARKAIELLEEQDKALSAETMSTLDQY